MKPGSTPTLAYAKDTEVEETDEVYLDVQAKSDA